MSKHTPAPWRYKQDYGMHHCIMGPPRAAGDYAPLARVADKTNAMRIVGCVNACAGIDPEAVPAMVKALERIVAENVAGTHDGGTLGMVKARAALALAKGEAK